METKFKMTYDKYKSLVPEETLRFTNLALDYLNTYSHCMLKTEDGNSKKFSTEDTNLSIFLHVLSTFKGCERYKELFITRRMLCIDFDSTPLRQPVDYSKLFDKYSDLFLGVVEEYNDTNNVYDYLELTPLKILGNVVQEFSSRHKVGDYLLDYFFGNEEIFTKFKEMINSLNYKIIKEDRDNLEKEIMTGLSPNVREYLRTASALLSELIENCKDEKIWDIDMDAIPLALLLALDYTEDLENDSFGVSKIDMIIQELKKEGVDVEESSESRIIKFEYKDKYYDDVYYIAFLFNKYFEQGIYEGKEKKDVTISGIIENVLRGNLNETSFLRDVIEDYNPDLFEGFSRKIEHKFKQKLEEEADKFVAPLYKNMGNDTKTYLEMATKIYCLIKEQIINDKHNISVLNVDDDVATLSLLISAIYFNHDIANFYKSYNITLEKILEFLNIKLTPEEIENCLLDRKTLVNVFSRFVEGNENKSVNLFLNKSTIMEDIFYHFNGNLKLSEDFSSFCKKAIEKQKASELRTREEILRKENERKTAELFDGMDENTINFFKRLSILYQIMNDKFSEYNPEIYSILFALINYEPNNVINKTLVRNKLNSELYLPSNRLCNYVIGDHHHGCGYWEYEFDVNVLLNVYDKFIFDKENGRKRTVEEIVRLIPVLCDENAVKALCERAKVKPSIFTNITEEIKDYKEAVAKEKNEKEAGNTFKLYDQVDIFDRAILIIDYLRKKYPDVISKEQLPDLSMLLSILVSEVNNYFTKNHLTYDRVCDLLGISHADIRHLSGNPKYYPHLKDFEKYFANLTKDSHYQDYRNLMTKFFEDNSALKEIIDKLNTQENEDKIDLEVLKVEVINEKDYMQALSIPEREKLLDGYEFKPIEFNDSNSIITFGSDVDVHFRAISGDLSNIFNRSSSTKSIESVQKSLAKVFNVKIGGKGTSMDVLASKISRKLNGRNMFMKVFQKPKNDMTLKPDDFNNVINLMREQIESLRSEIGEYEELGRYLEGVYNKNIERKSLASSYLEESNKALSTLNSEDYVKNLTQSRISNTLSNMLVRFEQSDANIKQTLARINLAIYTHSITISALEMAINTVIPLICIELSIHEGSKSERDALVISNKLVNVYQQLLSRNTAEALANIKQLEKYHLPETAQHLFKNLGDEVNGYAREVGNLQKQKIIPFLIGRQQKGSE